MWIMKETNLRIHKHSKGNIGDKYDASKPDYQLPIDGYTLDTNRLPDNMTGLSMKLNKQ